MPVAITVILAAVIGTFVLGLGDSLEQTPQAQLSAELTDADTDDANEVVINHNGGDTLDWGEIRIEFDGDGNTQDPTGEFTVGSSETVVQDDTNGPATGDTITLIHEPSSSIILETTL